MWDSISDGRRFRILTIVDDRTGECKELMADSSLSGVRVARELDQLIWSRSRPTTIVSDNVLCRENLSAWVSRSCGVRLPGHLERFAQTGSAVKK